MERTVRCSRTVRFFGMFGRFEVRFLAKIRCSDMFEVRFWRFWKKLGPFFINKVREQFGFRWCSWGSKFGFGPKWDVRMCSKFDPLKFGMFEVRFFDVRSTSNLLSGKPRLICSLLCLLSFFQITYLWNPSCYYLAMKLKNFSSQFSKFKFQKFNKIYALIS